jgi:hypothetical protein
MSKSICFIDDDINELNRFKQFMGTKFKIGVGLSPSAAREDLKDRTGLTEPDLYLLDLYYPTDRTPTESELQRLAEARRAYLVAEAKFSAVLAELGQSSDGGIELSRQVGGVFAFFSRKATFEDAIKALKAGAIGLIKKPDPTSDALNASASVNEAYDKAFAAHAPAIERELQKALQKTEWWNRHKTLLGWLGGFVVGVAASAIAGALLGLLRLG